MALALPTLIFEVSYGTDAWAPAAWVDETQYLRSFKCKRGKQHELGQFDAATSTLRLLNNSRRFDPTWLAGPNGGQLLPGVRFRIRAVWNAVTYPVLHQWAERWRPKWPDPVLTDMELTGVDSFKRLRKKKITTTGYAETVLADGVTAYYRMGEPVGAESALDSAGTHPGKYTNTTSILGVPIGVPTLGSAGALQTDDNTGIDTGSQPATAYIPRVHGVGWMQPPDAVALGGTGPFSVEIWYRTAIADAIYRTIVGQDRGGSYQEWQIAQAGGQLNAFGPQASSWAVNLGVNDGDWHHAVLTRSADGKTWTLYSDGVSQGSQLDGAVAYNLTGRDLRVGGTYNNVLDHVGGLDEFAIYSGVTLTAAQVLKHYQLGIELWAGQTSGDRIGHVLDVIGWPTADRALDAGASLVQPVVSSLSGTSALDYAQLIEKSEAGLLFQDADGKVVFKGRRTLMVPPYTVSQATFGDGPGEVPYEPAPDVWMGDDDVYSEGIGQRLHGNLQRVFDEASNDKYGPSTYDLGRELWLTGDAEVLDRLNALVSRYKNPATRIGTVRIHPLDDPATIWPLALGLQIGDRVTVKARPVPKTTAAYSQDAIIEGIEHTMTEDGDWFTEFALGAADYADYWVLGTSALGVSTRLAF